MKTNKKCTQSRNKLIKSLLEMHIASIRFLIDLNVHLRNKVDRNKSKT